ncbi:Uu.00g029700.m01.CDS01 [Anthostomella pinea]|uniref:Uu.00g029700.m01.CDS01 n=1 Tax=Anthostomella pinea TaxID=933095 RepID=A0AAI8YCX3_9PEZI|nr:Uu.00g029700.m01.CDS01 [Anthostomella pinea]
MRTAPKHRANGPMPFAQRAAQLPQSLRAPTPKRVDQSSPAYKQAARKYVRLMIAMPILLVTSYVLFDRLFRGNQAKTLAGAPEAKASSVEVSRERMATGYTD